MTLTEEIAMLRRDLRRLARKSERRLARRYALKSAPGARPGLYRRLRRAAGNLLRRLGLRKSSPQQLWLPALQQIVRSQETRPLIIWALGTDRQTLRTACRGFESLQAALPDWAPVLVTDVADFAFFSRLGWLVEFVPALSSPADRYAVRKQQYLAWRYRDAPAVPVSAGLREGLRAEELKLDEY